MSSPLSPFSDLLRRRFPSYNPQLSSASWATPNDSSSSFGRTMHHDNRSNELKPRELHDIETSGSLDKPIYPGSGGHLFAEVEEAQQSPVYREQQINHTWETSTAAAEFSQNPWRPSFRRIPAVPSSASPFVANTWPRTVAMPSYAAFHDHPRPAPASDRGPPEFQVKRELTYTDAAAPTATDTTADAIRFYHPMNCRAKSLASTQQEVHSLLLRGFSPNYRGDPALTRNQSALIPAEANCSLFLVGLAPDLTTNELLSNVHGIGRVYATHINPPDPARGHANSAAKLVFFERAAAERFYAAHFITGYATRRNPHLRARVTWNRVRSGEVDVGGSRSRVLLVSGPRAVADEAFLRDYLDTKLTYQTDEVVCRGTSDGGERVLLEFRFGSYRCQAEAARMALMREFRDVGVVCVYGRDPCCDPAKPEVEEVDFV